MIEWSKEGISLKSSFAILIPLPFCRASLQGARHSWYNFSSVYVHVLCVACAWLVRACIVRPSGFFQAITCTFMHGFQNNMAQLFTLTGEVPFETFVQVRERSRSYLKVN